MLVYPLSRERELVESKKLWTQLGEVRKMLSSKLQGSVFLFNYKMNGFGSFGISTFPRSNIFSIIFVLVEKAILRYTKDEKVSH